MQHPRRQVIAQYFYNYALTVGTSPTPITQAAQQLNLDSLIESIIFSLVSTAARSVFFGSQNVTVTNGLEIRPGKPAQLTINNERQLYEVQGPLIDSPAINTNCNTLTIEMIPFVAWDLSTCFLVAAAPTVCALVLFKAPFL